MKEFEEFLVIGYTREGIEQTLYAFQTYSEAFRAMKTLCSANYSSEADFVAYGLKKRKGGHCE